MIEIDTEADTDTGELWVELDGQRWKPKARRDIVIANDIIAAEGRSTMRAYGAALGVTWRGRQRPKASLAACGFDVADYGGRVINELLVDRGLPIADVLKAGAIAFNAVAADYLDFDAVKGAESFSAATGDDVSSG